MSERARVVALTAFFLLAGAYFSRPLLLHLSDALPYGTTPDVVYTTEPGGLAVRPSDIHQALFHQWLFVDNLSHGRSPFENVYEFGPLNRQGLHWLGVWGFPMQLVFAAFAWISPVVALNLVLIATFPITGLVHYALLRVCAVRPVFAFLGAASFTFALARRVQLFSGHMNGALYFTLSLSVLLYLLAIRRRSWGWSSAAGLSVFVWALAEWHMFYFSSLFFPLVVLAVLWALGGEEGRLRSLLLSLPLLGGMGLGAAYLLWYRSRVIVGSTAEHRTWGEIAANSPEPKFLLNESRHIEAPVTFGNEVESAIGLDRPTLVVLAVSLVVLAFIWRSRHAADASWEGRLRRALVLVSSLAGLVFALLSTGVHGDRWLGLYSLLHRYLPHFDIIRVPGRMIYLVYFCLAICLPLVLESILRAVEHRSARPRGTAHYVAWAVVAALVVLPLARAPGVLLSGVLSRRDLAPLREVIRPDEAVLLLPVREAGSSQGSLAEHFIVATQRSTVNGYAPNAPAEASDMLTRLSQLNLGKLSHATHRALWKLGVRHVVHLKRVEFVRPAETAPDYRETLVRDGVFDQVADTAAYTHYALNPPR